MDLFNLLRLLSKIEKNNLGIKLCPPRRVNLWMIESCGFSQYANVKVVKKLKMPEILTTAYFILDSIFGSFMVLKCTIKGGFNKL